MNSPARELSARSGSLPPAFWRLWSGYLVNRLGLLAPSFLALYLGRQHLVTGADLSLVIALYGAGQLVARLIGGVLSDRIGSRATISISQALLVVATSGLMISRSLPLICAFTLASGVLAGIHIPAAYSLTYLVTGADTRARAYGRLYWANNIGSAISTLACGVLLQWWPPSLFLLTITGAMTYSLIALTLPSTKTAEERPRVGVLSGALAPFAAHVIGPFLIMSLLLSCIYMQKQAALPMDLTSRGLTTGQFGTLLSLSAIIVVAVQPLASKLTQSLPQSIVFSAGAILIGVGFGLNAFINTFAGYAIAVVLWSIGEILYAPSAAAFMAEYSTRDNVGSYQGAYAFTWTLGLALGAPLGQLILTIIGPTALWIGCLVLGPAIGAAHLLSVQRRLGKKTSEA